MSRQAKAVIESDKSDGVSISFAVAVSIVNDKFEQFSFLMNLKERQGIRKIELEIQKAFMKLCFDMGESVGLKYFEMFLNSKIIQFDPNPQQYFDEVIKHGGEYFKIAINAFLDRAINFMTEREEFPEVLNVLETILKCFPNTEGQKLALRLALITNEFSFFQENLENSELTDDELLSFFQTSRIKFAPERNAKLLKLILDKLSPTAKILPIHVDRFLFSCLNLQQQFTLIWNDKRLVLTPEFVHSMILRAIKYNSNFKTNLISLVSQSNLIEYNLGKNYSPEIVKTTLSNAIWLQEFRSAPDLEHWKAKNMDKNLSEELFDMVVKVFVNDALYSYQVPFALFSMKQEWWNSTRIRSILLHACKYADVALWIQIILPKVETIDFEANNNEVLRVLIENEMHQLNEEAAIYIVIYLSDKIRFSNLSQKREIFHLTKLRRANHSLFSEVVKNIRVAGLLGDDKLWRSKQDEFKFNWKIRNGKT